MKVLLSSDLNPGQVNGVVISVENLKKELESMGHEVRLLTLSPDIGSYKDGDTYYVGSLPLNIYPDLRASLDLANPLIDEIIHWKPDIIHSQCEFFTYNFIERIARKTCPYIVHTYHTLYQYYLDYLLPAQYKLSDKFKPYIGPVMRFRLRFADVVVAPTQKTKKLLEKGKVAQDIRVIPTGIDINKFDQDFTAEDRAKLLASLDIPQDAKVYGSVGRLAKEKNFTEVIRAHKKVLDQGTDAYLVLVGDGKYRPELEKEVRELGIGQRVRLTGMVPSDKVYQYYKLLDFFISASVSETQGLTYIEALSSGLPVIARRDEAAEDVVIPGKNGFIYDEPRELEEDIIRLIDDEKLLKKLCKGALASRQNYSIEKFGKRVAALYEELLASGQPAKCCQGDLIRQAKAEIANIYGELADNFFSFKI